MSKLLLDESPLLVMPGLAQKVGLNESIVLQQIHYWNEINKKAKNNLKDGHHWTFNTYEEWQKQFPFWSVITIKRTFAKLEGWELVIAGNYNKLAIDRTKWYRVNYEALESLENYPLYQNDTSIVSQWYEHWLKLRRALPETSPYINSKNNADKTAEQAPPITAHFFSKDKDETVNETTKILDYYYKQYQRYKGARHPYLKLDQLNRVYDVIMLGISVYGLDYEYWVEMIDTHMERSYRSKDNDLNVNAFASSRNLDILTERLRCG